MKISRLAEKKTIAMAKLCCTMPGKASLRAAWNMMTSKKSAAWIIVSISAARNREPNPASSYETCICSGVSMSRRS